MPARYVNCFSVDDGEVYLVDREGGYKGPPRLERVQVQWESFVDRAVVSREILHELRSASVVKSMRDDGRFTRIAWSDRVAIAAGCQWLEEAGVPTYEGNVEPSTRLIVERGITPCKPRTAYVDIETDPRPGLANRTQMRILVIGIVDHATRKRKALVLDEDSDDGERRLLVEFWRIMEHYDQIVTWYGDHFDEPVLKARTKKMGIPVEPRRMLWLDQLECFKKQNAMGSESGDEKASFALDAVCRSLGLPGKEPLDARLAYDYWVAGGDQRQELVRYCLNDTDRLPEIEDKTGYLELFWTLCESTGVFPVSRNIGPSFQVESFLLRLSMERGHRFRSKFDPRLLKGDDKSDAPPEDDKAQFRGAEVVKPSAAGIHRDVHVVDFARMYPSVIRSLNLSPETVVEKPDLLAGFPPYLIGSPAYEKAVEETKALRPPPGCAQSSTGAWFKQDPIGILPLAVERLLELRKFWDNKKKSFPPGTTEWEDANRRSSAYKIAVNSFYGVIGQKSSMFFDLDVAESTTQTSVALIRHTIKHGEAMPWAMRAIYSDTDSANFVNTSIETMQAFTKDCNDVLYPRIVAEMGGRNYVALEYEKAFKLMVFSWNEKEKRPAAKKYAGKYLFFKGKLAAEDSKPEIKGLAFKRGDSLRLAREMQREVIELLIMKEESSPFAFDEMIERWKQKITVDPIDASDVKVSQAMTKGLKEYVQRPKKQPIALGPVTLLKNDPKGIHVESVFLELLGVKKTKLFVPYENVHESCSLAKISVKDTSNSAAFFGEDHELLVNDFAAGSVHVRAAQMLVAHGTPVRAGDKVEYVVIDGSVSPKEIVPFELWDGVTFDRVDLWLQVWTPSKLLLWGAFPDVDWHRFDVDYPRKVRAPKPASERKKPSKKKISAGQALLSFDGSPAKDC